jgi:hypothetical protein
MVALKGWYWHDKYVAERLNVKKDVRERRGTYVRPK